MHFWHRSDLHSRSIMSARGYFGHLSVAIELARPFTCVPPMIGVWAGSAAAFASVHLPKHSSIAWTWNASVFGQVLVLGVCAAMLNAGSNGLNQIYDLDIDAVNKPLRPLPSHRMSLRFAWIVSVIYYLAALIPPLFLPLISASPLSQYSYHFASVFAGNWNTHGCFLAFCGGAICSILYSVPLTFQCSKETFFRFRAKQHWFASNFTIALARGCFLKLAGWSLLAPINEVEPWWIGASFFLFLLFAASTKDFSDMLGDASYGCTTLPLQFGASISIALIGCSLVLPWVLFPIGGWLGILRGNFIALTVSGIFLSCYGLYVTRLLWIERHSLDCVIQHVWKSVTKQSKPQRTRRRWQTLHSIELREMKCGHVRSRSDPNIVLRNSDAARCVDTASIVINVGDSAPVFDENHPAWRHMYLLMMSAQLCLVASYLLI